jgi:hypothetical protein
MQIGSNPSFDNPKKEKMKKMAERWSGKRVQELLESFSENEKNFKTRRSGRGVKIGYPGERYGYCTHGYFRIDAAYGGYELQYVLPYSTGVTNVSPHGHDSSRKLAEFLYALGPSGLKKRYRDLERVYKPMMKERFARQKAEYQAQKVRSR